MIHCELKNTPDTRSFVNDLLELLGSNRFELKSFGSTISLKSTDKGIAAMVTDYEAGVYRLYVYESGIEEITSDNCVMLEFTNVDILYHI